jgi:uncharacterized membrane protein (DUF2068 family)
VAGESLGLLAGLRGHRGVFAAGSLYALYHHPGWPAWAALAINLTAVAVLARDLRKRRA